MLIKFDGVPRPVQIEQGLKVLPHLGRVFAAWPYREVPRGRSADPMINVLRNESGYVLESERLDEALHYRDAAGLAHGLATQLAHDWIRENSGMLWVEASAANFGDQVVVLVGGPRSGKNLLTAGLALSGNAVFADTVMPVSVDRREAMSLGLAPKLRLPLPEDMGEPLRQRIVDHLDGPDPATGYLRRGDARLANFGDRARVRAFVLLDRSAGQATALHPASSGRLLKRLLLNSFGEGLSAEELLHALDRLIGDTPCFRLAWSDAQDAVIALRARFASWRQSVADEEEERKDKNRKVARRPLAGPRVLCGPQFRHRLGLREHAVDNDLFLVNPGGETIYHLNGLGAGLWRLLDGSHGLEDAVAVLRDAFPDVDTETIETDVRNLVGDLAERGLLVEQSPSSRQG